MAKVDGPGSGIAWVLDAALLSASDEGWDREDADRDAGQCRTPPSGVPREDRCAEDVADRAKWNIELWEILSDAQVAVGEQHVPIREHEPSLCERVRRGVERWWDEPRVEQQG